MFGRSTWMAVFVTLGVLAIAARTDIGQNVLGVKSNTSWF